MSGTSDKEFYKAVDCGVGFANKRLQEITKTRHALDHPVKFKELEYLKSILGWVKD